jgi:large repetitive protein
MFKQGRLQNIQASARAGLVAILLLLPYALFAQATFDVKNYKASGDGASDDTAEIQAAINAAHAAGSGTVHFPASGGCYMVTGLTFYSNLAYEGENPSVCIKAISSTAALVSTPATAAFSNVKISNLTFNGNASSYTGKNCLDLRGPTNVAIDHVTTTRCGGDGVYVTGWGTGTNPTGQGNGLLITNLTSNYNGRIGLNVATGKNIKVRDSLFAQHTISAPFSGVNIQTNAVGQSVENITFENCTFQDNTYHGVNVWEAYANRPNLNLRLIDGTFLRNGRDGAYMAASGSTTYKLGGIYVSGTMSGNLAQSGYRGGLDIWNANNVVVTNLSVAGASQGLCVYGANGVTVANSSLSGSAQDLNASNSTNVRVYTSTTLAHQKTLGTFSRPSGVAPQITTTSLWPAAAQTAYSDTLVATGDPAITWAQVDGTLPPGVAVSGTGAIAGTPTTGGTYVFTVRPSNSITYDEKTFAMTVSGAAAAKPPAISTIALPGGTVGAAYATALAATGGKTPYTWTASGLAAGLSLNSSTGQITGTPTAAGTFSVSVQVRDANAATATKTLALSISAAAVPPAISTASLPGGTVGAAYSAALAATGGKTPYTWSASGLVAGLSLNSSTGQIVGTPAAAGTFPVSVQVRDANAATATKTLTLLIATAPVPPAISTTSLPGGTAGTAYSAALAATGGKTPYTWSASGLAAGLNLNSSTGQITGTPTAAGTFNVSVQVMDATATASAKVLTLVIGAAAPPPPSGTVYNVQTYGAKGNGSNNDTSAVQAAINAAHSAGSGTVYFPTSTGCYMVSGLTLYSNITYTGQSQSVCVKMISSSAALMKSQSTGLSNATISNLTLNGNSTTYHSNYSCLYLYAPTNVTVANVTTTACGEDGLYITGSGTNNATAGDGLLLNNVTSTYNGRNAMSIIAGKHITVRNSTFAYSKISAPYDGVDIEPNNSLQAVENITFENSSFLNNGVSGNSASGHNGFNVWQTFANLPNLNLQLINCTYSGNVRDGLYAAASGYKLTGISVIGGTMSNNHAEAGYRGGVDIWNSNNIVVSNLNVTGASQAVFLSGVSGAKIASSTLSASSYDVAANSSSNVQLYTSTTLVQGTKSGSFTTPTGSAPQITTASLPAATAGAAYSQTLAATGTAAMTWSTFSATGNSLPPGLSLSSGGILSGTPSTKGTYTFTAEATNAVTCDLQTFTVTVN